MLRTRAIPIGALAFSLAVLSILALQYPLSSSFPIGGDAPFYVRRAQAVLNFASDPAAAAEALRVAWYPVSIGLFTASAVLPLEWPIRFIVWMTLGHILAGIALGALLYRLQGWQSAALGMAIWAVTTTGILQHIEDGTMAHLWSFVFLAVYLERIAAKSAWGALLALGAAILSHPITGLTILLVNIIITPMLLAGISRSSAKSRRQIAVIASASLILAAILLVISRPIIASGSSLVGIASEQPFIDLVVSRFAPFMLLIPVGLITLLEIRRPPIIKLTLASLFSVSLLLAANDVFGINLATARLRPTLIFTTVILAALALHRIGTQAIPQKVVRGAFFIIFFAAMAIPAWQSNQRVFAYYENPDNYARLHPAELEAIHWIDGHLPPDSLIFTSQSNRHTEWLPALTRLQWIALSDNDSYLVNPQADNVGSPTYNKLKYLAFFTIREEVKGVFAEDQRDFPLVYANEAVSIFNIPQPDVQPE